MHGFQNNLAHLLSSRSRSVIGNICSGKLKVKVTCGRMYVHAGVRPSKFVQAITCTFMHGFQNNMAQLLSSRRRSAAQFETFVHVS